MRPSIKKRADLDAFMVNLPVGSRLRALGLINKGEMSPYTMVTVPHSSYAGAVHPVVLADGQHARLTRLEIKAWLWKWRRFLSSGAIEVLPPLPTEPRP